MLCILFFYFFQNFGPGVEMKVVDFKIEADKHQ